MRPFSTFGTTILVLSLFVLPTSTSYEMHDFGFGSGGNSVSDSTSYSLTALTGEVSSSQLGGTTYDLGPGLQFTRQSNTPTAPTVSNPSAYYNKLAFTIATSNNPADTLYAVAISNDGFSSTSYVQADGTVGINPVYQTYAAWGGSSGSLAVGLATNSTYSFKVRAVQTKYTESAFSAVATAATVLPSLSYDLDVSATDSESAAPYTLNLGTLLIGSVTTANSKIWLDITTNAEQGAVVYVYGSGAGLTSASTATTITSASVDLAGASEGFGIRSSTASQTSGGPLSAQSPYAGSNDVVGIVDTTARLVYSSGNAPITGGRASLLVKAKASTTTKAADDYTTSLTLIASGTF